MVNLRGCFANLIPIVSAIITKVVLQVNASATAPLISPGFDATRVISYGGLDRTKRSAPQEEDRCGDRHCKKRAQARRKNKVRDELE